MVFAVYWYSEKPVGARNLSYCKIETSINCTPDMHRENISGQVYFETSGCTNDTDIYLHGQAASEPSGDNVINETTFSGEAEDTYSTAATGYIKSWTSETGFFTSTQNFDDHDTQWLIQWNGNYTGTPPEGEVLGIKMEFYKRNASNVDTLLFSKELTLSAFKSVTGYTTNVIPTGIVTSGDRLRIRILATSQVPT